MDETRIYSVDSETFNELSHANDELIQYLQWLIERKELEAINKLSTIVRRMTDLFLASSRGLSRKSLTLLMPLINFATK
jgi:CRP-like cAMP-binding protein